MLTLLKKLIACPSITPEDAGCQAILIEELTSLGFKVESLPCGNVKNFWAKLGNQDPLFVFAGHTDVVPPGPLEQWDSPPFTATLKNDYLVGRGVADMKGAIAAMITACRQFLKTSPSFPGSIGFLITGNEEGTNNLDGTKIVIEHLQKQGEIIHYCIVGEASSQNRVGDAIKVGRRGSLSGFLTIHGKQGHIAFSEKAINPITLALPFLNALKETQWDQGNEFFPPTSFQFANIHAGNNTMNVIPNKLEVNFNFRYSPENSVEKLQEKVITLLKNHSLNYTLNWIHSASPFLTKQGKLIKTVIDVIEKKQHIKPLFLTDGGTSDARFIAPTGAEVIELGVCHETIHQANECSKVTDLETLTELYYAILTLIFKDNHG